MALILPEEKPEILDSTSRNNLKRNAKCHWAKASTGVEELEAAEVNDGLVVRMGLRLTSSSLPALNS